MNINELKPAEGSKKDRKRIGRGHGTGWGKTAGKGHNGQKQRSGSFVSAGFEGGQMPLYRRMPKRGFNNINRKEYAIINLNDLNKFEAGSEVTIDSLKEAGIVKKELAGVKLLANGKLDVKLTVKVNKVSESAKKAVETAGGTVEVI